MVRDHVRELVSMGLLIPRSAGTGGYANPTNYSIGIAALDRHLDRSIPPPDAIVSPRLLKFVLHADLKPHRKLLLWTIAMMGDQEFPQELLARALFRSTSAGSLEQLRRDLKQLEVEGFIARSSSRGGAGRGIRCQLQETAITAIAMTAPQNPRYQLPPSSVLPFAETPGTDRTETPGTVRTETPGTHFLRSGTSIGSGDLVRTGTDRKNLSVVSGGEQRPVHAAENSAPPSPSPARSRSRSTNTWRARSLTYEMLCAECQEQIKLAIEKDGYFVRSELRDFAKSWCHRQHYDRFALPGRRPESSKDIVDRVVSDAICRYEKAHGTAKEGSGAS